jgi:hypothetical protein
LHPELSILTTVPPQLAWYMHINKKKCPSWTNFIGPNLLLSEMIRPCKCFPRVSNMQILKYNWLNGLWNFIYIHCNVYNLRDTEVVVSYNISSIKENRCLSHHLNTGSRYIVVRNTIVRNDMETPVNYESKYNDLRH